MKKLLVLLVLGTVFGKAGYSQDPENSIYSVPDEDKLYKVTVWRRMYMEEKQNQSFFARNKELSKILVDAVRDGLLIPFANDSLKRRMAKEEFEERLTIKTGADEDSWGGGGGDEWSEDSGDAAPEEDPWATGGAADDAWGGAETAPATVFKRVPTDLNILEMKEEVFFDKIRSRMYYAIQSLTLYFTDETTGLREPVASFDYQEVEKVFRANPETAVWYNRLNPGQNRNMADAFLLRLFHGMIIKISNPNNLSIREEVGDPQLALYLSQQREYKIAEYESDLWSY